MAWERPVLILPGMIAGEDLSTSSGLTGYGSSGQYLFAKMNPNNVALSVVHCNSVRDRPLGVIQGNPASGKACDVMVYGVTKVVAGEALVPGLEVGPNAAGRAVRKNPTSTGANYGDYVAGVILEGALAAGSLATMLLTGPYRI